MTTHMTLKGQGHDPNMLKNSWRCYLAFTGPIVCREALYGRLS